MRFFCHYAVRDKAKTTHICMRASVHRQLISISFDKSFKLCMYVQNIINFNAWTCLHVCMYNIFNTIYAYKSQTNADFLLYSVTFYTQTNIHAYINTKTSNFLVIYLQICRNSICRHTKYFRKNTIVLTYYYLYI